MQNRPDPVEVSAGTEAHEIWLIFNFTLKKYFVADRKYEVGSRCTAVNLVCVTVCTCIQEMSGRRKVSPDLHHLRESWPIAQLSQMLSSLSP